MPESVRTALLDVERQPTVYEELPEALVVLTEYARNQTGVSYDDKLEAFRTTNVAIAHCLMKASGFEIASQGSLEHFFGQFFARQVSIAPVPLPPNYDDLYRANDHLGKLLIHPGKTAPDDYRQDFHTSILG